MRTSLVFIMLAAIALSACSAGPGKNSNAINSNANSNVRQLGPTKPLVPGVPVDANFKACNSYYPLVPGSRRKYAITYSSGITADATVVVEPWEENGRKGFKELTQIIDSTGGYQINQM